MNSYELITKYLDKFNDLLNFLIPNNTKFDIKQKETNIEIGNNLIDELKDFNIFSLLEKFYFSYGSDDTEKMVTLLKLKFSYKLYRYKRDYNIRTFEKAKGEISLYETNELGDLIKFSDYLILGTILEFKHFENHYLPNKPKQTNKENPKNDIFVNDASAREKELKNKINLKIESLINEIDKNKGWESLFFEEKDYHEFKDILIKFFSEPNFEIPTTTIKTKHRTVGKVSILLKGIHEHFSEKTGHLINDERFHKVVKILHEWKDKHSSQIYKAIYKG